MILDDLANWSRYPLGPAWERVFTWLDGHRHAPPAAVTPLDGDGVVVRPGRYGTLARPAAVLEAHRRFADVQVVVAGREWGECHDRTGLAVATPHDDDRDVEFYVHPDGAPARFLLEPGRFVLFWPGEAHMTQLAVDEPGEVVVKLVVKVDGSLLRR